VGDGSKIKIWEDKWLPNLLSFDMQLLVQRLERETRVKEFIDEVTGWWNVPLAMEIFNKEEGKIFVVCPLALMDMIIA
jgi:hypothetical protein